jgi:multidrug efflux system membrane fusion protein
MTLLLKKPYLLALLIAATLAAWLLSGQTMENAPPPSASTTSSASSNVISVRVRELKAKPFTRQLVLTGRTAPFRTVLLRAEINARVEKIGAPRGARVKKGDLIARLAIDDRALRLKEAQALLKQRQFEYQAQKRLSKKGYQSQVQIANALTLLENARTLVEQAQIALSNTTIVAPYHGVLVSRPIEEGDYVSVGDTLAELIDDNPFLLVGEVTELQRHQLQLGQTATAHLVTEQEVTGQITLISARADEATRTFDIEIQVPNPKGELAAGMTGEIRIPTETVYAHQISAALLSLNDEGVLGVKTVGNDNRVIFYTAQFARATSDGIWLTGLPKRLRFISVGQGFVRAGDLVQPVLESSIVSR